MSIRFQELPRHDLDPFAIQVDSVVPRKCPMKTIVKITTCALALVAGLVALYQSTTSQRSSESGCRTQAGSGPGSTVQLHFVVTPWISAASDQTLVLAATSGGNLEAGVKSFGDNSHGQLGIPSNDDDINPIPTLIDLEDGTQVAAGGMHALVLLFDNTVKSFGSNDNGELGIKNNKGTANPTPTLIEGLENVVQVAAGERHSLALLSDNRVKSFGSNVKGQLGIENNKGTDTANPTPTLIGELENVIQVAAGGAHSLALLSDNTVMSFGNNEYGQLGIETNSGTQEPHWTPTLIQGLENVVQVAAGWDYSLVLLSDNTVKSFGYNYFGQLGMATNVGTHEPNPTPTLIQGLDNVIQVAAGGWHSLVLLSDNTVMSFGLNHYGQLGIETNSHKKTSPTLIQGLENVIQVAAGGRHSLVLLSDNTVMSFGANYKGQLGIDTHSGTDTPTPTPTVIQGLTGAGRGAVRHLVAQTRKLRRAWGFEGRGRRPGVGDHWSRGVQQGRGGFGRWRVQRRRGGRGRERGGRREGGCGGRGGGGRGGGGRGGGGRGGGRWREGRRGRGGGGRGGGAQVGQVVGGDDSVGGGMGAGRQIHW